MSSARSLLVVDDDELLGRAIRDHFSREGLEVVVARSGAEGISRCEERPFDVVVLDERLPDGDGSALCGKLLELHAGVKIVFVTGYPSFDHAVRALKAGAHDYLSKPFELEALALVVRRCGDAIDLERARRREAYRAAKAGEDSVLAGAGLAAVREVAQLAADCDSPVLITGETGTGKNLVAKAIHFGGSRSGGPFVPLNCAALPEHLVEAEIMGWERGAFTGAVAAREGVVELSDGGTLFLDEMGELPIHVQAKLLSVLEEREVRRIGGRTARRIDLRVVAATNAELEARVESGAFRPDLFYRLDVIRIRVPPLRDRLADLPELCEHVLRRLAGPRRPVSLAEGELERLARYRWPGNVRELRNVLERALVLHRDRLRPSELLAPGPDTSPAVRGGVEAVPGDDEALTLDALERKHIEAALRGEGGNLARTARRLAISISTLKRKLRRYSAA